MLKFTVKDFRAIKKAVIELPGITVLSGENGCGKSTISKLVYHTLYTACNFDTLANENYSAKKNRLFSSVFDSTIDFLFSLSPKYPDIKPADFFLNDKHPREYLNKVYSFLQTHVFDPKDEGISTSQKRFAKAIASQAGETRDDLSIEQALKSLMEKFREEEIEQQEMIQRRPLKFFYDRLRRILEDDIDPQCFDISEMDVSIFNHEADRLSNPFDIKNVFYIDTPWAVDKYSNNDLTNSLGIRLFHRKHLINVLRETDVFSSDNKHLSDNIIGGKVGVKKEDSGWRFEYQRTADNKKLDLFHCATGVKAFSILHMLYHGGLLTEETLLVLDEPEAHLHPQWIVEYARLIVLLSKECGVRFLISSHSTDMVSAIQSIAQKEKVREKTRFYLAKPVNESRTFFDYENLGFDIGPIFGSFNKSLDKVAEYGADIE